MKCMYIQKKTSDQNSDRCHKSKSKSFSVLFAARTELLLSMLTNGIGLYELLELLLAHLCHSRIRTGCQALNNGIFTYFVRVCLPCIWLHVLINLGSANADRDEGHNPGHFDVAEVRRQV